MNRQFSVIGTLGVLGLGAALMCTSALATDEVPSPTSTPESTSSIQKVRTPPVVVAPGTPLQVELSANVDSKVARVGDRVEGRLAQDLAVGDRRAALAGAAVTGRVTGVVPGGPRAEDAPASVELTFDSLQAANGATVPIVARYHHPAAAPGPTGADPRLRAGTVIAVPTETSFSIY